MLHYYTDNRQLLCAARAGLPLSPLEGPPERADSIVCLVEREPLAGRGSFALTAAGQRDAAEGVGWLDSNSLPPRSGDPLLDSLIDGRRVRAVNFSHPRWRELLSQTPKAGKKRLNLLALGDVGSTLLLGLRLLGGGVLSSIGICDMSDKVAARWEYEMNQIAWPWDYDALPEVEIIPPARLFDCDLFVFCASKGIPPVGSTVRDVRMAQFDANAAIVAHYARQAREARFKGLFAVVSDPVDPLCKTALLESNRGPNGSFDHLGLFPEQIQGYGLGVMNARAAYFAKRDERFASFLTEGRAFGPHGEDLVVANSIARYDDALSRELTRLAVTANLKVREAGFKPYVAPSISSGAMSLLLTLRGEWHCGSTYLGGVYMGARNRFTPAGLEVEALPLPPALMARVERAAANLFAIV